MKMSSYYMFFRKLATPLRIRIIESLLKRPKTVSQLIKEIDVEQSKLSHALKSLSLCHIVDFRQDGKKRVYSLNKETVVPIIRLIEKHEKKFCKRCCIK